MTANRKQLQQEMAAGLVGKTIQAVEFDEWDRHGRKKRDVCIEAIIFTDGSRLLIEPMIGGANESDPFCAASLTEPSTARPESSATEYEKRSAQTS